MKNNMTLKAQEALAHFNEITARAVSCQQEFLSRLMEDNRDTEIGRRLDFADVHDAADYQALVPLSDYYDYAADIGRMVKGERNILTKDDPVYFCISSGSTDEPKYMPLTERDLKIACIYGHDAVFDVIGAHYGWTGEEDVTPIFQVSEFVKTYMPDGLMSGIRSSSIYQWMDRDGTFDTSGYCCPREVIFPKGLEDLTYVRLRFALATRNIRTIFGVFVHRLVGMMNYITTNWDMLLEDMREGKVSPEAHLSAEWTAYLNEKLPPDPKRADELAALDRASLKEGMLLKLWPELKCIIAIGGSVFAPYMEQLEIFSRGVPLYPFVYAATEGVFALCPSMDKIDEYVLIPDACYFEFLPEHSDSGPALTLGELKVGERYELVISTVAGLYRYRMEDVVEVTGFYNESPAIRFCYRKNQVINVADERTNIQQFDAAVKRYCRESGVPYTNNHCLYADFSVNPPRYCVCMESNPHHPDNADELFDQCLCQENFGYRGCRHMGEVGMLRLIQVPKVEFENYERRLVRDGKQLSQIKPLRIIVTDKGKQMFEKIVRSVEK